MNALINALMLLAIAFTFWQLYRQWRLERAWKAELAAYQAQRAEMATVLTRLRDLLTPAGGS